MNKMPIYSLIFLLLFLPPAQAEKLKTATLAGGCFWCMEPPFEKLDGVKSVISGFSGGEIKNPSYKQVSNGKTKHIEAVQITYDSEKVSYEKLLKVFWVNINPTDGGGQFNDRGHHYTTAIFYNNESEKELAQKSKSFLEKQKYFKKSIATVIRPFKAFYPAEEYHQDFYKKSIVTRTRYKYYRAASGRDKFIEENWKGKSLEFNARSIATKYSKPTQAEIKKRLTKLQYKVTQEEGTERPFKNEFWESKEEGIYVDIVSGEPLFSSKDKFKSGTGWPSFTKPLEKDHIIEKVDKSLFSVRTEVRSKYGDSHLGHVFKDGPPPTNLRYCINSASLRFVKKSDLEKEGFGQYLSLFKK